MEFKFSQRLHVKREKERLRKFKVGWIEWILQGKGGSNSIGRGNPRSEGWLSIAKEIVTKPDRDLWRAGEGRGEKEGDTALL